MGRKTWILFLIMCSGLCAGVHAVAGGNADSEAIKQTVMGHLEGYLTCNPELIMSYIAPDFSSTDSRGDPVTYERYKARVKSRTKNFINNAFKNVKIKNVQIHGDSASLEEEHDFRWFNVLENEDQEGTIRTAVKLKKENGAWKITDFRKVK
jgi:hypothetical protein